MIKKMFFGVFICLAFFIVLDIALRIHLCIKNKDTQYLKFSVEIKCTTPEQFRIAGKVSQHHGYYKFESGKFGFWGGDYYAYSINSLGFRGDEFSKQKPKGLIRICALGGSTTFGHPAGDHETYPYYLEKILNNLIGNEQFEVINCGIPGLRMENIYNLFKEEVINYQPDMLIVYEAWNDAYWPPVVTVDNLFWKLHGHFYYKWMLYTVLLEKYSSVKQNSAVPFFYKNKQIPKDYGKYLRLLIDLAQKKDIEVVLVKQAANILGDDVSLENCSFEQLESMYQDTKDYIKSHRIVARHYYLKEMEEIGKEYNLLIVDPVKIIMKRPDLFTDVIHLNAEGNRILAEIIAKAIYKKGRYLATNVSH